VDNDRDLFHVSGPIHPPPRKTYASSIAVWYTPNVFCTCVMSVFVQCLPYSESRPARSPWARMPASGRELEPTTP
jgi:hypothetical protein